MPNSLGPTGVTVVTQAELLTYFTTAYQTIYGANINLASNTPDAQNIMTFIQAVLDNANYLTQIYNSMDPDQAIGVVLDQRVAINGIQRQAGTFTVTNVTLVLSQSVNLYGLDQTAQPIFTVADNAGNNWQLQFTQLGVTGTQAYSFQAANPGAVFTTPNTITVPVTIVLGVSSINNPATYTSLGVTAETDAALRIRRQISVSLVSQGYLKGLLAAIENINGVTGAFVYENDTDATDANSVPSHSIWVIVAGSGSAASIAQAIYTKRNAGCGMFGSVTFAITQADGSQFIVRWDNVIAQNLFIQFNASSLDGVNAPNVSAIKAGLVTMFIPGVNAEVNINQLATIVQEIDPNTLVTGAGFSATALGSYTTTLKPAAKNNQFDVVSANISITVV
jgi:uncharacterized phage protein gp47/JayE